MLGLGREDGVAEGFFFRLWNEYGQGAQGDGAAARAYTFVIPEASSPLMRKPGVVKKLLETMGGGGGAALEDARARVFLMLRTGAEVPDVRPIIEEYVRRYGGNIPQNDAAGSARGRALSAAREVLTGWNKAARTGQPLRQSR